MKRFHNIFHPNSKAVFDLLKFLNEYLELVPHHLWVIIRVILARNDVLTPFDLRVQIFRVNVEFSTCCRGQKKSE